MGKLSQEEINSFLSTHNDWYVVDEKWIARKYRFTSYLQGIDFVKRIAQLSEERNHHPFIAIDYKLIVVKLSSWKANGLTDLDTSLACEYDAIYLSVRTP